MSEQEKARVTQDVTGGMIVGLVLAGVFLSVFAYLGPVEVVGYTSGPILALIAALLSFGRYEVIEYV